MGIAGALGSEAGFAEGRLAAEPPAVYFAAGILAVGVPPGLAAGEPARLVVRVAVGVPPGLAIGVAAGVLAVGRLAVGRLAVGS
jgi:hypothetical protein